MNLYAFMPYLRYVDFIPLKECHLGLSKVAFIEGCPHIRGGIHEGARGGGETNRECHSVSAAWHMH